MIVDRISQFLTAESKDIPQAILDEVGKLAQYSFARQFGKREDKPKTLRLSSIGKCPRSLAYGLLGFEEDGKEIDSRAKCTFWNGDQIETLLVMLMRSAGLDIRDYGLNQKTVEIDGVQGHPDGVLRIGDEQAGYEDVLVECKSMSSFSFKTFQEQGHIDPSYQYQIQAYLHALGLKRCVIVGFNKDAGVFHEFIVNKDQTIVDDVLRRIGTLRAVTKELLPERPYGPSDKGLLPWNCLYCGFWRTCWPKAERIVVSGKYKLKLNENENTSDGVDVGSVE